MYRVEMNLPPTPEVGTSFKDPLNSCTDQRAAANAAEHAEHAILELHPNKKVLKEPSLLRQYHAKIDHLNAEAAKGKLEYTEVGKRSNPRSRYADQPELLDHPDDFNPNALEEYDLDHKTDLQLGGKDEVKNYQWLDKRVNRSVGAQLRWQMVRKKLNTSDPTRDTSAPPIHAISDKSRPQFSEWLNSEVTP